MYDSYAKPENKKSPKYSKTNQIVKNIKLIILAHFYFYLMERTQMLL